MDIYRDIEILKHYDILLVDAYGVFRSGNGIMPGAKEAFVSLMSEGKLVIILSNTTKTSSSSIADYEKHGIIMGVHYHNIVTSGDIAQNMVQGHDITFDTTKNPRKFYCFGTERPELWKGSCYQSVLVEQADFVYISIPQLEEHEVISMSDDMKKDLYVSDLFNEVNYYDSITVNPFLSKLHKYKELGLPAFSANPDMRAFESVKSIAVPGIQTGSEPPHYVVRQGAIAEIYKNMGMQVIQAGKPDSMAFKSCLDLIKQNHFYTDADLKRAKIAMLGDTLNIDILGALRASRELGIQIDGILTLTGMTMRNIADNIKFDINKENLLCEELATIFKHHDIVPNHIIERFAV